MHNTIFLLLFSVPDFLSLSINTNLLKEEKKKSHTHSQHTPLDPQFFIIHWTLFLFIDSNNLVWSLLSTWKNSLEKWWIVTANAAIAASASAATLKNRTDCMCFFSAFAVCLFQFYFFECWDFFPSYFFLLFFENLNNKQNKGKKSVVNSIVSCYWMNISVKSRTQKAQLSLIHCAFYAQQQ